MITNRFYANHMGQRKAGPFKRAHEASAWVLDNAATDATCPDDELEASMYLNELQTRTHNPILQDWTITQE